LQDFFYFDICPFSKKHALRLTAQVVQGLLALIYPELALLKQSFL
jgi:hypothetical protein